MTDPAVLPNRVRPDGVRLARSLRPVRVGSFSRIVSVRALTAIAVVLLATLAVFVLALGLGRFTVAPLGVVNALLGNAEGMTAVVVLEWRLARAVAAVVFGAALGAAGAIFQSLTRNPLGSPDVIGFSTGSYTGALVAIIFLGGGFAQTATGAIVGGMITATLVYLVARGSGSGTFGIIIVGIALTAVLSSLNTWMMLVARLDVALSAAFWGMGSLNGVQWERLTPAALALIVPFTVTLLLWRRMVILEMGDDIARSLGVRPERTRLTLILAGVLLTAIVTAVAGPIAFVALAAPQIARRLTGTPGVDPVSAAVTGGLLLASADILALHAFGGELILPVGVVTVSLGGCYLVWLLVREARKGRRV
ncbi:FecCD family ABC transporter permease [Microbacterium sp.]|uniref:FecCD family ABC transporter permease n=1 Tax=Microbacterium sp. TaxID=51671 RepID=UPI003C74C81F